MQRSMEPKTRWFGWQTIVLLTVEKEMSVTCINRKMHPDFTAVKMPWRRKRQPTSIFLPGKPHGQRSLVGYSPWGHKESDTTERLSTQMSKEVCLRFDDMRGTMAPFKEL